MADYVIEAEVRTVIGKKVKQLRNQGIVPITVYGPNIEPMSLQVPYRPLEVALMKAGGTNIIAMNAGGKTVKVLARYVQRHAIRHDIMHVDFFAIDADTKITAQVPIQFINESPAVDKGKGMLMSGTNTITIETLPSNLINVIEVDISVLEEVGDQISVKDITLGADIAILDDPDEMIARISQSSAARAQEKLDALDAVGEEAGEEAAPADE